MDSFPGTAEGFQLLPTLALADLLVMREVESRSGRALAAVFVAYAAVRSLTLFMDGYTFFASALVGLAMWVAWAWRSKTLNRHRKLVGGSMYLGAGAVAGLLYVSYAPDVFGPAPLEAYRSLGLDVITLVVPSERLELGSLLGVGAPHTGLWGDGSNALFNYVGPVVVVLAAVGLVRHRADSRVVALAVAGTVALVLCLQPQPEGRRRCRRAPGAAESLPRSGGGRGLAALGRPLRLRAGDRQHAGQLSLRSGSARMALIILAALGVAVMLRSRRLRLAGVVLGVLALIDTAPQVPDLLEAREGSGQRRELVRRDLVGPLQAATRPGERVFYLQGRGPGEPVPFRLPHRRIRAQLLQRRWRQERGRCPGVGGRLRSRR